jgi:hypothetical protein
MRSSREASCEAVTTLHARACSDLFAAYGLNDYLTRSQPWGAATLGCAYASVMSATGPGVRLASSISLDAVLLARMHPLGPGPVPEPLLQDWCRELNNQLMGRMKNMMLRLGCEVTNGLPSLISGSELMSVPAPDVDHRHYYFSSMRGRMALSLAMGFAPDFYLDVERLSADAAEVKDEGALWLF